MQHLKWSLITWGSYPESAIFISAVFLFYVSAQNNVSQVRRLNYLLCGIFSGLTISLTLSNVWILSLPIIAVLWKFVDKRGFFCIVFGQGLGMIPVFVIFHEIGFDLFRLNSDILGQSKSMSEAFFHFKIPMLFLNFKYIFFNLFSVEKIHLFVLFFISVSICTYLLVKLVERRYLLVILFVFVFSLPIVASFFDDPTAFKIKNIAGIYPAMLAIPAIAACHVWSVKRSKIRTYLAQGIVILLVIAWGGSGWMEISKFLRLKDIGMVFNYRPLEYRKHGMGNAVGIELKELNCLLDGRLFKGSYVEERIFNGVRADTFGIELI